jgi:energy-coupling factor transport system ATP-binding protein
LIPQAIPAQVSGRVRVAGLDVRAHTIPEIAPRIGMVFQRPTAQLFHLRVEDEVAFGPRNLGLDEAEVRCRTEWALEAVGIQALRDRAPAQLSGGQKQCVAIAAVLAMRPQVMVLDEPTAALDVPNTHRVIEALARLQAETHLTLLLIEHRLVEAVQLAGRAILMEAGRIVGDGRPAEVFADRALRHRLGLRRLTEAPPAAWSRLIQTGPELAADGSASPAARKAEQPLLALKSVTAGFNGFPVIHAIDLELYAGEFVALVGDNGTGKSTLALAAAGLIKPQAGEVRFIHGRRPRPGLDVGLLFQDPPEQLFTDSVDEEVAFGPENYACFDMELHARTLRQADLWELRQRRPLTLSVGQQQRTALAACLSLQPRLLILDEPTLGQDWGHLQQLMNYLQSLNRQGAAILLISHDYRLVHRYAQRVILMKNGRIERLGRFKPTEIGRADKLNEIQAMQSGGIG